MGSPGDPAFASWAPLELKQSRCKTLCKCKQSGAKFTRRPAMILRFKGTTHSSLFLFFHSLLPSLSLILCLPFSFSVSRILSWLTPCLTVIVNASIYEYLAYFFPPQSMIIIASLGSISLFRFHGNYLSTQIFSDLWWINTSKNRSRKLRIALRSR